MIWTTDDWGRWLVINKVGSSTKKISRYMKLISGFVMHLAYENTTLTRYLKIYFSLSNNRWRIRITLSNLQSRLILYWTTVESKLWWEGRRAKVLYLMLTKDELSISMHLQIQPKIDCPFQLFEFFRLSNSMLTSFNNLVTIDYYSTILYSKTYYLNANTAV